MRESCGAGERARLGARRGSERRGGIARRGGGLLAVRALPESISRGGDGQKGNMAAAPEPSESGAVPRAWPRVPPRAARPPSAAIGVGRREPRPCLGSPCAGHFRRVTAVKMKAGPSETLDSLCPAVRGAAPSRGGTDALIVFSPSFQSDESSLSCLPTSYLKLPKISVRYVRERKERGRQPENPSITKGALSIEVSRLKFP